jgi:hypothetical protein
LALVLVSKIDIIAMPLVENGHNVSQKAANIAKQ